MKALEGQYRLADLSAALEVSRSGYHAWKNHPRSARAETDAELGRHLCEPRAFRPQTTDSRHA